MFSAVIKSRSLACIGRRCNLCCDAPVIQDTMLNPETDILNTTWPSWINGSSIV